MFVDFFDDRIDRGRRHTAILHSTEVRVVIVKTEEADYILFPVSEESSKDEDALIFSIV
jgi:hypothetical protein